MDFFACLGCTAIGFGIGWMLCLVGPVATQRFRAEALERELAETRAGEEKRCVARWQEAIEAWKEREDKAVGLAKQAGFNQGYEAAYANCKAEMHRYVDSLSHLPF